MNKIFVKAILFALVLLFNIESKSQQFNSDAIKFLDDVESFLGKGGDRKLAKDFINEFTPIWNAIPEADKQTIYTYSNSLVSKGAKAFPEYYNYIHGIHGFFKNKHPQTAFAQFHEVIDKIFGGIDKKKYDEFLKMTDGLFNTGIVFENVNIKWRIISKDYKFTYDKTPVVNFALADICVISIKNDSSLISKTSGVFKPLLDTWNGHKGTVTWERTGLDKTTTYAELNKYRLNLKTPGFDADSCLMYTEFFEKPLEGRMSDKLVNVSKTIGHTYPKFQSYSKRLYIKEVFPEVDYEGGFALDGASLYGTGSANEQARLIFFKDGKRFLNGFSQNFIIKPDKIVSEKTRIVIYLDKDSITHPGLDFKYDHTTKTVSLNRVGQGTAQSPYYNSYHQLDMKFETMTWKLGTQDLNMGPTISKGQVSEAYFESANYFSMNRYQQMMGMDAIHPAIAIEQLYLRKDTMTLNLYDVCSALGGTKDMVLPTIFKLSEHGLLDCDTDQEKVFLKKKLFDYTRAAGKKKDFDVIIFDSQKAGNNASLNLLSYDLTIEGVKRVTLSDTQFVKVYPKDEKLVVKKNRSFTFDGIINAGATEYFGKNFSFDYEGFLLNVIDCDSMRLRVKPLKGQGSQIRLSSLIIGVKGVITIDGKDNKAGVKRGFEKYPIFECNKESYVFFNKIYRGVYDSTKFYFKNEKFILDSLDNFKNTSLRFNGEFHSAGIFPMMKEALKVMPDYSLGFTRKAGDAGAKIYADKGIFKNEIRLSGKGLQGDGKISFLTSFAESDAFTFFPDSTNGVAKKYENTETTKGMNVPKIKGIDCFVKYAPKEKLFTAKSLEKPLMIYDSIEKVKMKGTVMLRESGMTARGRVYFNAAELGAKKFIFRSRSIDSDTASFKLKNFDETTIALKTENVKAHIDFDKRFGEFASNGKTEPLIFEEVKYICFMDRFKWFMDREDLTFESDRKSLNIDTDLDLAGSNFFSIHPDQDSLNFMAPKARYDMKNIVITAEKVTYLDVADARIIPDSQKVVVRKNANMDEFKNSQIIANSVTKYHRIFNATVKVLARKKYTASGDYLYVDEDKKESSFHFAKITVDTSYQTYADGEIKEDMKFMLSSNFAYKGKIALKAIDVGLNFDGATKIVSTCNGFATDWFTFKGVVDPLNIEIPIAIEIAGLEKKVLSAGLVLNNDSVSIYPTFFSEKIDRKHTEIIKTSGILIYDKDSKQYKIGTKEKFSETSLPGNMVTLGKENCVLGGDGKMDLGMNLDMVKVIPVGKLSTDLTKAETNLKVAIQLDFPFIDNAMEKMAEKINKFPDLVSIETSSSNMVQGLREMTSLDETNKMMEDLLYKGKIKDFPDKIKKSIVLTDVDFKWGTFITEKGEEQGWEAKGKAGICNIYGDQVLKLVNVKIRILKRKTGDQIQIAFWLDGTAPESAYYYFKYVNGLMSAYSSDTQFNNTINETKDDKKKFKGDKGVKDLTVTTLSSGGTAIGFMTE
jgi:hypothetical protein